MPICPLGNRNILLIDILPEDSSAERMQHILGRYEHSASEYYSSMLNTAHNLCSEPVKRMSRLTQNLLKGIDYQRVCNIRNANYATLSEVLDSENQLTLIPQTGPFVYPLYCRDGIRMQKDWLKKKIFVPTYWSMSYRKCQKKVWTTTMQQIYFLFPVTSVMVRKKWSGS